MKLNFAVIGCGRMGLRRIQAIAGHPQAKLSYVVDVNQQDVMRAAREFGCPAYPEYGDVVSRKDVDCVVVSVPNKWHPEPVIEALKSKKHVFCEKPLARNPEEAMRVVEANQAYGMTLKVGSNLRYYPSVLKAKELLDREAIGRVLWSRSWIGHEGRRVDQWLSEKEVSGGGAFLDNGSHIFDLVRWFMGDVTSCIGTFKTYVWPISPVEDNGYGLFETADGKTAFVQASWTEWAGYMYMEIYGLTGFIRIDNRGKTCKTILGDRTGKETEFDFSSAPANSYELEFENYIQAILRGEQPLPGGHDGLRVVQMAYGVYESSRTQRRVKI